MAWTQVKPTLELGKRETLLATQIVTPPADLQTLALDVSRCDKGVFQLNWADLDAFNARFILQGSLDGINWNDLGGEAGGIILDIEDDTQIWELTEISFNYLRADFTANNVTTGALELLFKGYTEG